jgi:hypothetical protein
VQDTLGDIVSYFAWLDTTKQSIAAKLDGGIDAYIERYGVPPSAVLLNPRDSEALNDARYRGLQVQAALNVPINNFWFGPIGGEL